MAFLAKTAAAKSAARLSHGIPNPDFLRHRPAGQAAQRVAVIGASADLEQDLRPAGVLSHAAWQQGQSTRSIRR